ncbi:SDR family oxidoreductase [Parvibaculum sp.]|uniref:SDR family oxidoreductase n=1 Tax=Parvibaculum sp. TaxID=2024848 RepID=UPI001B05BDC7|nr:SDR family oxidoreductase [Parvibaculum sp.]MBO6633889.1 SDR family oxidoreductase [Parvibaculum sp.]MBO6677899.1 SDR family oxidoreductase [Parvibaculum sp.]MBO6683374.1 SDR family oxidoreductase [Parvibaculum sp.]MBO6904597.1 SDR family oxidoreductase [Parvibaculum sp.]
MKSVVITGVSTGIGHGAAKVLTQKGFHVFGSVRKREDGERLKKEFGDRFTPLLFDVTDEAAVKRGAETVRAALNGEKLFGLVNNAGIAVSGPLIEVDPDDFRKQLEVNVTGPLLVTQAFAPLLGVDGSLKGKPGRIVNISSVGGKRAFPFIGPYAASKFALEGFSESLRRELMLFGIDVIVIGPGAVKTAIWDKAEEVDISRYGNSPYLPILQSFQNTFVAQGRKGLPPEKLGRLIHKALTAANPKVRYAANPASFVEKAMMTLAPKRTLDKVIAKTLGLTKQDG